MSFDEGAMTGEGLFDELPEAVASKLKESVGRPRMREPVRDQLELRAVDLDSIIGTDHPARILWAYVERLDLSELEARIKAREGRPGHPPITPRLLLALWLYATSEGVGSGRALERLCESHDGYRWLAGGVSVNYHTLNDFRVAPPDLLDELLAKNVAALAAAGLVDLDTLAQDGIRVRAAAGAGSFRRRITLEKHLKRARRVVARLRRELDEDPEASNRRIKAARERAAREREARVAAALDRLGALEEERRRRTKTNAKQTAKQKQPRASTTDPEARVIKMPDGGFRPAWNMQIASAVEQQIVVAVEVTASGSDRGLVRSMLEAIGRRFGRLPRRHLADGGFTKGADIEWAAGEHVAVHCPPPRNKHKTDPFAPRPNDGPGVAAWRRRMRSPIGKARYKRRAIIECINARGRRWTLDRVTVRGRAKALSALRWFALANNILQGHRLARLAAT
jgi:transposase